MVRTSTRGQRTATRMACTGITAAATALAVAGVLAVPAGASVVWTQKYTTGKVGEFSSVAAADAEHIWAFGDSEAEKFGTTWVHRWNGTKWAKVATPPEWGVEPTAADASGPKDLWAAGLNKAGTIKALHFDGTKWTATAIGKNHEPIDVEAAAPDDVWVSAREDALGTTEIFHFNGSKWTKLAAAHLGTRLSVAPTGEVFLAGGDDEQPTIERWTGTAWEQMDIPPVRPGGGEDAPGFTDVYARAADDVWAVGNIITANGDETTSAVPLLAHYDGDEWTVTEQKPVPGAPDYARVVDNGRGGLWIQAGTWNPSFVNFDGTRVTETHAVPVEGYDLSIPALTHVPGTFEAAAVGMGHDQGDPEVFTTHGVVVGYGF